SISRSFSSSFPRSSSLPTRRSSDLYDTVSDNHRLALRYALHDPNEPALLRIQKNSASEDHTPDFAQPHGAYLVSSFLNCSDLHKHRHHHLQFVLRSSVAFESPHNDHQKGKTSYSSFQYQIQRL